MQFMQAIWKQARVEKRKIVLAEGEERRNLIAAGKIIENSLADLILIGNEERVRNNAKEIGVDIDGATIVDPDKSDKLQKYIEEFYEIRKNKGMTLEKAEKIIKMLMCT